MKLRTIRKRRHDYPLVPSLRRDKYYRAETWERDFPIAPNFIDAGGFKVLTMLLSDDYLTVKTLSIPIPLLKIKKKWQKNFGTQSLPTR